MAAVTILPRAFPKPTGHTLSHHIGSPPTSFRNPWPSAGTKPHSFMEVFRTRFFNSKHKNHVPAPPDRKGLPKILTPDWGLTNPNARSSMKVTWIGHASFLVEMPCTKVSKSLSDKDNERQRGVRILFDPVFSDNMSPFSFGGPKRISAPPCDIEALPDIDVVVISHDHYDHLDITTIQFVNERGCGRIRYLCSLGVKTHLVSMGVTPEHVEEFDWWDGAVVNVEGMGQVTLICTPSQHGSGRWWNDQGKTLWCSWVLQEGDPPSTTDQKDVPHFTRKNLFFAGDTGYRCKTPASSSDTQSTSSLPSCPAFPQIGTLYGPFDLALLPIGCYAPRSLMSRVHAAPEDSIQIHHDVKSKKSIGMHFGTVRGKISEFYEDSVEPARLWRGECEKGGMQWGGEIGVVDIGETVCV